MIDLLIIFCAKYLVVVPPLVLVWCYVSAERRQKHRLLWLALVSSPIAYAIARLAGHLYDNARPFVVGNFAPLVSHIADNGFPSDHTLISATIAMLVLYFNRPLGLFLWVVTICVGAGRVLAGVHHTVDVLASMVIAAASIVIGHYILHYLRREKVTFISS